MYLIESGCLKATYHYEDHAELLHETMVAGTVAGEMTALSGVVRNATVVVERDASLWKLTVEGLDRLQLEKPKIAREFVQLVLKSRSFQVLVSCFGLLPQAKSTVTETLTRWCCTMLPQWLPRRLMYWRVI